jgi:hypothetical protein
MIRGVSELPKIAISVSPSAFPFLICLTSLSFAHHSQLEIIPLTVTHFL